MNTKKVIGKVVQVTQTHIENLIKGSSYIMNDEARKKKSRVSGVTFYVVIKSSLAIKALWALVLVKCCSLEERD